MNNELEKAEVDAQKSRAELRQAVQDLFSKIDEETGLARDKALSLSDELISSVDRIFSQKPIRAWLTVFGTGLLCGAFLTQKLTQQDSSQTTIKQAS